MKTDRFERKDTFIIRVEHFKILLSVINRTSRQKISKGIEEFNNTIYQLDLIDILEHPTQQNKIQPFQVPMEH